MNILRKHALIFGVTSVSEQIIIISTVISTIIIFTEDLRSDSKERSETEQWWRSGESTRLPPVQCGADSISKPEVLCGLSFLVLFSALRGFALGTPVFPSP